MARAAGADGAPGVDGFVIGAGVHVESDDGASCPGHITSVSDRIVGVRGYDTVDRQFRVRDEVTLHLGHGEERISCRAQVLAADGWLLRLVRRDDSADQERRRTPRLRVQLAASVALHVDQPLPTSRVNVELIDLSSSGCAFRCGENLRVGTPLRIAMPLASTPVELGGVVVRTWTAETPRVPHSGIQFDPIPAATTHLLNRFLIDQFRAA